MYIKKIFIGQKIKKLDCINVQNIMFILSWAINLAIAIAKGLDWYV